MGWAARQVDDTCWSPKDRTHSACGGSRKLCDAIVPRHAVWLTPLDGNKLIAEYNCNWQVDGGARCDVTMR